MSKTLRRVFVLLPCAPGLTLLAAGLVVFAAARDQNDRWRAEELFMAGGAVVLVGLMVGTFIAWRIAHPRPDEPEEENPGPPAG